MAINFIQYAARVGKNRPGAPTPDRLRQQVFASLRARLEASLARAGLMGSDFGAQIRTVTLVASCSRSGSSYFMELLHKSPRFLHCCGEINPFLQMTERAWPEAVADSDWLQAEDCSDDCRRMISAYLAGEVGTVETAIGAAIDDQFIERLYRRVQMQWPLETIDVALVRRAAERAVVTVEAERNRPCDWSQDTGLFHLAFLKVMRHHYPAINPYYYDLDHDLIDRFLPGTPVPEGPPSPVIIEEPPFVLIRPMRAWTPQDLATHPLLIKTPSNVYRMGFLENLFPNATFRVLHLTRNPAASINGLLDGWRHPGFHSHFVGADLAVPGYSEPGLPDHGWWKFDLPPAWRALKQASLEEICSYQWYMAQEAILTHLAKPQFDYLPVRFEDVLQQFQDMPDRLDAVRRWLGDDGFLGAQSQVVRAVMSTAPPKPRRWLARERQLRPFLDRPDMRAMALELGYKDEAEWL